LSAAFCCGAHAVECSTRQRPHHDHPPPPFAGASGSLHRTNRLTEALARYVSLFNGRDWDSPRALLADDVKLHQSAYPVRVGSADVGNFFSIYAEIEGVWLVPAWLGGREVVAVFSDRANATPDYFMWLEWLDGRISFIRDYRYVRYVIDDTELTLAPPADYQDAEHPSD